MTAVGEGLGAPAPAGGIDTGAPVQRSPDPVPANRAEWLELRRGGIGGSDVAALVGLSPWRSPVSVWLNKVSAAVDEDDAPHLRLGRDLEPIITRWFNHETGLYVHGAQTLCRHPQRTWAIATVDGFVADAADEPGGPDDPYGPALGVLEAKYSADPPWDEIPVHYQAQGQWELFVTGLAQVWFAVMHLAFGHPNFRVYELQRNIADIELLVERAERFWLDHVVTGVMPPTDGSPATTTALAARWGHPERSEVELSSDFAELVRRYLAAKDIEKVIAADTARLGNEIRAALGEHTDGLVDGQLVASWRSQASSKLDAKALRNAHPDIAETFTVRGEQRVLRTHLKDEAA